MPFYNNYVVTVLLIFISINSFANNSDDAYSKAHKAIKSIPPGSTPITACSYDESKKLIKMLLKSENRNINTSDEFKQITINGESANIYKGDFANQGNTQYAIMIHERYSNWVEVYSVEGDKIVNHHFNEMIENTLLPPGSDMSRFGMTSDDVFAIQKEGKTYLRFTNWVNNDEISNLNMCYYLWENNQLRLSSLSVGYDDKSCYTPQPGFDCSLAKSKIEHKICDNQELAILDRQLSTIYTKLKNNKNSALSEIFVEQKKWLKDRENQSDLAAYYKNRIATLTQLQT